MSGSNYYKPEETIFHNDGREEALLDFIHNHPQFSDMKGSPERILAAIDEYGRTKDFLMNVGQEKGRIVSEIISTQKPQIMIELGGYVGYSALLFGAALKRAGGQRYISLEASPVFAGVSSKLISLAGLDDIVEVVVGPCRDGLRMLHDRYNGALDLIFIDHAKKEYVNDLKLCEELGLVKPGTTVLADNVISPGNPQYLHYVRSAVEEKQAEMERILTQDHADELSMGNPQLIYDSHLVDGLEPTGEPDGVEVSKCVGVGA